jgi:hypothetical protein
VPRFAGRWPIATIKRATKIIAGIDYDNGSFVNSNPTGIFNLSTDATLLKKFQFGDNAARYLETRIKATNVL